MKLINLQIQNSKGNMTAVNPFSSQDRDHFPDFDAVFKPIKTTPSNKQVGFSSYVMINAYRVYVILLLAGVPLVHRSVSSISELCHNNYCLSYIMYWCFVAIETS